MPTRLLSVPHRPQIEDAGCLGACAQMIMNYLGLDYSQATLNGVLGLTSIGTPYRNIQRLSQLGVRVAMQIGVDTDIQFAIDHEMPPIVFLMTGALPYWSDDASHSVVVVCYNGHWVFLPTRQNNRVNPSNSEGETCAEGTVGCAVLWVLFWP